MKALLSIAGMVALRAYAADFCAVHLNLIDSQGRPATAPVALINQDGQVEASVVGHGRTSFCDMAFGPHTIRIGEEKCSGYVTIHGISLVHGMPRTVTAVWDGCPTGADGIIVPPSCLVSFRVTSSDGKKLSEADVAKEGDPTIYHADTYGRFFLAVANGSVKDFTFFAPGYVDKVVRVPCQKYENIERVVQMTLK